jgi:YlmC/YmxH family sporulation protein
MLISELVGKEIININDGAKLGAVGETDLVISPETGQIESLILPSRGGFAGLFGGGGKRDYIVIPWPSVKKIGSEVIIVDMGDGSGNTRKYSG